MCYYFLTKGGDTNVGNRKKHNDKKKTTWHDTRRTCKEDGI